MRHTQVQRRRRAYRRGFDRGVWLGLMFGLSVGLGGVAYVEWRHGRSDERVEISTSGLEWSMCKPGEKLESYTLADHPWNLVEEVGPSRHFSESRRAR